MALDGDRRGLQGHSSRARPPRYKQQQHYHRRAEAAKGGGAMDDLLQLVQVQDREIEMLQGLLAEEQSVSMALETKFLAERERLRASCQRAEKEAMELRMQLAAERRACGYDGGQGQVALPPSPSGMINDQRWLALEKERNEALAELRAEQVRLREYMAKVIEDDVGLSKVNAELGVANRLIEQLYGLCEEKREKEVVMEKRLEALVAWSGLTEAKVEALVAVALADSDESSSSAPAPLPTRPEEYANKLDEIEHESVLLKKHIAGVETQLRKETARADEAKACVAVADVQKKALKARLTAAEAANKRLEEANAQLSSEFQALAAELGSYRSSVGDVRERLEQLYGGRTKEQEKMMRALQTQVAEARVRMGALESDKSELTRVKDRLSKELNAEVEFRNLFLVAVQEVEGKVSALRSPGEIDGLEQGTDLGGVVDKDAKQRHQQYAEIQQMLIERVREMTNIGKDLAVANGGNNGGSSTSRSTSFTAADSSPARDAWEDQVTRLASVLHERIKAEGDDRIALATAAVELSKERRTRAEVELQAKQTRDELEVALAAERKKVDIEALKAKNVREQLSAQRTLATKEALMLNTELEKEVRARVEGEAKMAQLIKEVETVREAEGRLREMVERQSAFAQETQKRLEAALAETERLKGFLEEEREKKLAAVDEARRQVQAGETEVGLWRLRFETTQAEFSHLRQSLEDQWALDREKVYRLEGELERLRKLQERSITSTEGERMVGSSRLHQCKQTASSTSPLEIPASDELEEGRRKVGEDDDEFVEGEGRQEEEEGEGTNPFEDSAATAAKEVGLLLLAETEMDEEARSRLESVIYEIVKVANEAAAARHQEEKERLLEDVIAELEAAKEWSQQAVDAMREEVVRSCRVLLMVQSRILSRTRRGRGDEGGEGGAEEVFVGREGVAFVEGGDKGGGIGLREAWRRLMRWNEGKIEQKQQQQQQQQLEEDDDLGLEESQELIATTS